MSLTTVRRPSVPPPTIASSAFWTRLSNASRNLTGDAAHHRQCPSREIAVEMNGAAARALGPQWARHRHDLVADHRQIDGLLPLATAAVPGE